MRLDVDAAKTAVGTIGEALGLDVHQAAAGILDIVNENMAGALRLVSVQRGYDPRDFALVAFGGAGPMHANAVAALMGSFPVIVPPAPGVLCAEGDLVADFREEFSRTFIRTVDSVESGEVVEILESLGEEAMAWLEREGIEQARRRLTYNVDVRYYRQGYEIPVEIELSELSNGSMDLLVERFNQHHEQFYGYRMEGTACEIVNLRAVGVGKVPDPPVREEGVAESADASAAVVADHQVYREGEWIPCKIYDRAKLRTGNKVHGPAIITEFDSTTVVLAGFTAEIDRYHNILINPSSREE